MRPGYKIQEVPANEKLLGNSEKELGVWWSAGQKKASPSGKLLRSGGKAQPMLGSLGDGNTSLDQPDKSGSDRLQGGLPQMAGLPQSQVQVAEEHPLPLFVGDMKSFLQQYSSSPLTSESDLIYL